MARVSQDSILGPLLFLLYTYLWPPLLHQALLHPLFSSTTLTSFNSNLTELYHFTHIELKHLCRYFRLKELSLHPEKKLNIFWFPTTASLNIISNSSLTGTMINTTNLEFFNFTEFPKQTNYQLSNISVFFDQNLNFKHFISNLSSKLTTL